MDLSDNYSSLKWTDNFWCNIPTSGILKLTLKTRRPRWTGENEKPGWRSGVWSIGQGKVGDDSGPTPEMSPDHPARSTNLIPSWVWTLRPQGISPHPWGSPSSPNLTPTSEYTRVIGHITPKWTPHWHLRKDVYATMSGEKDLTKHDILSNFTNEQAQRKWPEKELFKMRPNLTDMNLWHPKSKEIEGHTHF